MDSLAHEIGMMVLVGAVCLLVLGCLFLLQWVADWALSELWKLLRRRR